LVLRLQGSGFRGWGLGLRVEGSEAGSYLRLIDFVYHSTLGLRLNNNKKRRRGFRVEG